MIDILIHGNGSDSVFLFEPRSPRGAQWIEDNVGDDAQYLGNNLAVEHRYARQLAGGMMNDGLEVR